MSIPTIKIGHTVLVSRPPLASCKLSRLEATPLARRSVPRANVAGQPSAMEPGREQPTCFLRTPSRTPPRALLTPCLLSSL
jgi:hypothetical protein